MDNKTNVAKHAGRQRKTERPILFSGDMVQAILDGRKTQTRRVVRFPHILTGGETLHSEYIDCAYLGDNPDPGFYAWLHEYPEEGSADIKCPFGQPGDHLWVREAYCAGCAGDPCYRATCDTCGLNDSIPKWRPSIQMPRWASRITLEITGVRVERLQGISGIDAKREGVSIPAHIPHDGGDLDWAKRCFQSLWQSLNAKRPGCSWEDNPWVWVVEFQMLQTEKRGTGEVPNA